MILDESLLKKNKSTLSVKLEDLTINISQSSVVKNIVTIDTISYNQSRTLSSFTDIFIQDEPIYSLPVRS